MQHNLFTHPTEAVITFDAKGAHHIEHLTDAQNLMDVLADLKYDTAAVNKILKQRIEDSTRIPKEKKREILGKLYLYLSENSYLKTIQALSENNEG